ncbi:hypothetical protein QUF74_03240 [Candidatus Halobeggiatoa sp. HSG11]|nr:hypothetical protein [Candidatus Halobeggiatoa sp. HSG11]
MNVSLAAGKVKFTVTKLALDPTGDPIDVGNTGAGCPAPPNPPTAADLPAELSMLNLLGLGAIGLAAFRRRRDKFLTENEKAEK